MCGSILYIGRKKKWRIQDGGSKMAKNKNHPTHPYPTYSERKKFTDSKNIKI